jgi:hypothetical protein
MSDVRGTDVASRAAMRPLWWLVAALAAVSIVVVLVGQWLTLFVVGVALATGGWVAGRRTSDPQRSVVADAVMYAGTAMAVVSLLALVVLYPTSDALLRLDTVHD